MIKKEKIERVIIRIQGERDEIVKKISKNDEKARTIKKTR